MTRLELLKRIKKRKKELGITIDNISKLSKLGNRTVTRFLNGEDVKLSTVEKLTNILGLDFAGKEIYKINTIRKKRARKKALDIVSLVQDTSALEMQGLEKKDIKVLIRDTEKEFLNGKFRKNLWAI